MFDVMKHTLIAPAIGYKLKHEVYDAFEKFGDDMEKLTKLNANRCNTKFPVVVCYSYLGMRKIFLLKVILS